MGLLLSLTVPVWFCSQMEEQLGMTDGLRPEACRLLDKTAFCKQSSRLSRSVKALMSGSAQAPMQLLICLPLLSSDKYLFRDAGTAV